MSLERTTRPCPVCAGECFKCFCEAGIDTGTEGSDLGGLKIAYPGGEWHCLSNDAGSTTVAHTHRADEMSGLVVLSTVNKVLHFFHVGAAASENCLLAIFLHRAARPARPANYPGYYNRPLGPIKSGHKQLGSKHNGLSRCRIYYSCLVT